jgi:tellurite resistance protein TerA
VAVEAVNANRDDNVYTFVPAVIHIGREGARIEAVELYSRRGSELRPTVSGGVVTMDSGEENSNK